MNQEFDEFIDLIEKSVDRDPWIKDRGLKGYTEEILSESKELVEAAQNDDLQNLMEELGDILSDWAILCKLAEENDTFTMQDVMKMAIEKIKHRRPYVMKKKFKKITKEQAVKIWTKAKNAKG